MVAQDSPSLFAASLAFDRIWAALVDGLVILRGWEPKCCLASHLRHPWLGDRDNRYLCGQSVGEGKTLRQGLCGQLGAVGRN